MKKIFYFVTVLLTVLAFSSFAYAADDNGGIYSIENSYNMTLSDNLDGTEFTDNGSHLLSCGDFSSTKYNRARLSSFKVKLNSGDKTISIDLAKDPNTLATQKSVEKYGIYISLENTDCPKIYVNYTNKSTIFGDSKISLNDPYKISAAWTYAGKKYSAKVTVLRNDSKYLACLTSSTSYKKLPLIDGWTQTQTLEGSNTRLLMPTCETSYYTIVTPGEGMMTFKGCEQDPSGEIFKTEDVYYRIYEGAKAEKFQALAITIPDNLDENKVYTLNFEDKNGNTYSFNYKLSDSSILKGVAMTSSTNSVKMSWESTDGATGYRILKTDEKFSSNKQIDITDTEYTFDGLKAGSRYTIMMMAVNGKSLSTGVNFNLLTKPLKIKSVKATANGSVLNVSWSGTNGTGYQIQIATNKTFTKNAKFYTVNKVNTTSKKIKSLTKGKTYYVRVRAINTYNDNKVYGAWSPVVKAKL